MITETCCYKGCENVAQVATVAGSLCGDCANHLMQIQQEEEKAEREAQQNEERRREWWDEKRGDWKW